MKDRYNLLLKTLLILGDIIAINIIYALTFFSIETYQNNTFGRLYSYNLIVFNLLWFLIAGILNLYKPATLSKIENIFRQTAKTIITHFAIFMAYLVFTEHINESRSFLLHIYLNLVVVFVIIRFLLTVFITYANHNDKNKRRIAIIGYNDTGKRLEQYFNKHKADYAFAGFFDDRGNARAENNLKKIVGSINDCVSYAIKNNIQEIYSTIFPEQYSPIDNLVDVAERNCVRVKFVPNFEQMMHSSYHLEYLDNFPVVSLRAEPLEESQNWIKKRVFDIVFSALVSIFILSWLLPILAILIKLESKGPIFFKQLRSGRNNKPFWCYKLRTMRVNKESDATQATKNDPRITKIGAFLRKTSMDELPQFFNVLLGNMSVIGPRPHMLKHTEQYSTLISRYMVRQFLYPGITGWAQVNGFRGETKDPILMQKRVEHDIWYMENWSIMQDIKIIFLTTIQAFKGDTHAY